jgi:hypothetical protein
VDNLDLDLFYFKRLTLGTVSTFYRITLIKDKKKSK